MASGSAYPTILNDSISVMFTIVETSRRTLRVLIVEDEPRLRDLLSETIPEMGFPALAVRTAEEGLRIMGRPGVTINATVLTAAIRVYARLEPDIGTVVAGNDRLRAVSVINRLSRARIFIDFIMAKSDLLSARPRCNRW